MPKATIGGYDLRKPAWRPKGWIRIAIVLAMLAFIAYRARQNQQNAPAERPAQPAPNNIESPPAEAPVTDVRRAAVVRNQTIYDLDRRAVFRGDVDLSPTLKRIEAGERLRFSHDGATFENREGRLPQKPAGYYREYVHPTPGLSGPGPQRVVIGQKGETFYTPDHYRTFQRVDEP